MPHRVPVVLSREEVSKILKRIQGTMWIVVALYGAGLRLQECLELREKDIDFDRHEIVVRRGKGQKDRRTMLPVAVEERLKGHLLVVKRQHERDLTDGLGRVVLPFALDRKYRNAATDWAWQFVFPASRICPPASTCTNRRSSGRSRTPCVGPASRSASGRTASGTHLRRTFSRTVTTFEPCKSCSGIRTSLHEDDLYPRAKSWRAWRSKSVRPAVGAERRGEPRVVCGQPWRGPHAFPSRTASRRGSCRVCSLGRLPALAARRELRFLARGPSVFAHYQIHIIALQLFGPDLLSGVGRDGTQVSHAARSQACQPWPPGRLTP
jgi:hypothetical protein